MDGPDLTNQPFVHSFHLEAAQCPVFMAELSSAPVLLLALAFF